MVDDGLRNAFTVAWIGPDGVGKTTIARHLVVGDVSAAIERFRGGGLDAAL